MRQGIIIFADAPAGKPAEAALKAAVDAALQTGASVFLAYGDPASSQALRPLVGGPPPRFFPQAARTTLGERIAQAFAFLFVQDFERVALLTQPEAADGAGQLSAILQALDAEPVAIDARPAGYAIALRRADFPAVAAIFEDVAWERPGAKERAAELLAADRAKA
jgi:hypothetical protein